MTLRLADAAVNAEANALDTLLAAGSIEIRTGSQPATANTTATGTVLGTITLLNPAFGDAVTGTIALSVPIETTAVADGTAGYARFLTAGSVPVLDAAITEAGGGGQLIIDTASVLISDTLKVLAFTYTRPKE